MWHFIMHWIGIDNASGTQYLFWSGIFGDATIFAAAVMIFRHVNCHVKGCPRLGKHNIAGGKYRVCSRHHPEHKGRDITYNDVYKAHKAHRDSYER